jgi:hypothetical protein
VIDSCIGIDPGLSTGMCFLDYQDGQLVGRTLLTADGSSAGIVLKAMLLAYHTEFSGNAHLNRRIGSVESWVDGPPAGGKPAVVTRQLVMELAEALEMFGYAVTLRSAGQVKPWATDKMLEAAGITGAAAFHGKQRDAFDAARHCLFGAKEAGVISNPLIGRRTRRDENDPD